MSRRFFQVFTLLAGWLISENIIAQDSRLQQLPSQWTLQECIEYAKKNNIQVRTLRWSERSGEEDFLQAKAARLPDLSGSASQNFLHGKNSNTSGTFGSSTTTSANYSLNSSLTIYNGGFLRNDIKQKDLLLQSAGLDVKEVENDISLTITQNYLNILLAHENIISIQDVLTTSQSQLKLGQLRYDTGAISRKDLVQLEAQVAADQYTLVTAQNNYRLNLVALKQTLQLPSSYDMQIVVPDTVVVQKIAPSLAAAQQAAQQVRPEIKNSELGVDIAELEMEKARAQGKPSVSVGGSLSTGTSTSRNLKYFSQLDDNFFQTVGITLGVPIFNRRVTKTAVNKSKIQIEQAKLDLLNTKTVLDQQVEQAYINMQGAQAQYDAASVQMRASEESYRISSEQFRMGAINLFELQQQRNLYVQALQAFIQAKYNAVLNYKIVEFYTGVPITL